MSQKKINPNCPCTSSCVRHGNCDECKEHHSRVGTPTACMKIQTKENDKK